MTNEELAVLVKNGEQGRMADLWDGVEGFVKRRASVYERNGSQSSGVTFDDLVDSGYFALVSAVKTFDPAKAKFLSWFNDYLRTAFNETAGVRTEKGKQEPLRTAGSLDAPLPGHDNLMLTEVMEDPTSDVMLEEKVFNDELHEALESALSAISPEYSNILRMRYYEGMTCREVADVKGMSRSNVSKLEAKGLEALRQPEIAYRLCDFYRHDFYIGSKFYRGAGFSSFECEGMSLQEKYLILTEDKQYMDKLRRKKEQEAAEKVHQQAKADLINEIQSKQAELDISARQLLLATGMAPKTLKRRMEDPDGLTIGELWKIIDTLHLDQTIVQSALGYIQQ